jgi:1-acyl-sn-glycerol-3-phosphate acyltransferase
VWIVDLPFKLNREIVYTDKTVFDIKTPIVFVSNHKGILDPFIISNSLPFHFLYQNLPVRILASTKRFKKTTYFVNLIQKSNILNIIYWLYQCIPLKDEGSPEEKLENLQNVINKKYSVLIFPEGGIVKGNDVGDIKQGVSILRKNNPEIPFVFASIKYKKTRFPFIWKSCFVLGSASLEQKDDYQEFVKVELQKLLNLI